MYKALIVEDEKYSATVLEEMTSALFNDIEIVGIATNVDEAVKIIHQEKPNIIFLDINLGARSGFEIIKQTNHNNYEIIVTTAHSEHAIEAIKNSSIDFILKPFDFEELKCAVIKAKEQLALKNKSNLQLESIEKDKISIPTNNGIYFVELRNILYIKADSCYSEFYLMNNEKKLASKLLSYYENILNGSGFLRVHKSYIINVEHIKRFQKGRTSFVELSDGTEIPIADNKKQEIMRVIWG